jgi:beta-alanine--pyruvate transaminase
MYFKTPDGRSILDASAGLWCSAAGMNPAPVVEAVKEQLDVMAYAPSFQVSHDKAFEWAEAVAGHGSLAGRGLSKVFFSMCGSTAVDTALKMALAYQRARGKGTKTRFIGRERS